MEINELLPVGSVIKVKDEEKRIMIFGVKQTNPEKNDEIFDYVCVPYPEGNLGLDYQYLINHDAIVEVVFRGFEDNERDLFLDVLNDIY